MCNEYSGYTNYATWNVSLWIDNDEGLQNTVAEWAEDAESVYRLAEMIKDYVEEMNPVASDSSMFSDMMQYMIDSVNFDEIAQNFWDEYHEEESEDEDEEVEDE